MAVQAITHPESFKVGSTWVFVLVRKDPESTPIDLTGLVVRATFRMTTVSGKEIVTLTEADGIVIEAIVGKTTLTVSAAITSTVTPGEKVFFDVEMTNQITGYVWQSPTYRFKTESQVTQ